MKLQGIIMCSERTWSLITSRPSSLLLHLAQRLTYGGAADLTEQDVLSCLQEGLCVVVFFFFNEYI